MNKKIIEKFNLTLIRVFLKKLIVKPKNRKKDRKEMLKNKKIKIKKPMKWHGQGKGQCQLQTGNIESYLLQ